MLFSERWNFPILKIDKIAWKSLNEEKQKQSENKELEVFERVMLLVSKMFFENLFSN